MPPPRAYNSPLREEKARQTREAILAALFDLLQASGSTDDISMDAIARQAGVERRTLFRHFATRDDLLAAFWQWINARIGANPAPRELAEIIDGPRLTFPRFDSHDGAIRAALHSRTGQTMRAGTIAERRTAFRAALAPVTDGLAPGEAASVEALAHLLFSASAWEVMKDYGGLNGTEAGQTASWALEVILSAITSGQRPSDRASLSRSDLQ